MSDISNTVAVNSGLGVQCGSGSLFEGLKRSSLEPHTPARRSSAFTVFDEAAGSVSRAAASPPRLPTKSRGGPSPLAFGENRRTLLGIEELWPSSMEGDLPEVQDFSDPVDAQEQYARAMSLDGCDQFGTPADLAGALLRSTRRVCLQAHADQALRWGHVELSNERRGESPSPEPGMRVWPTLLTPRQDRTGIQSPSFSPLPLPPLTSIQMDVSGDEMESGSDSESWKRDC